MKELLIFVTSYWLVSLTEVGGHPAIASTRCFVLNQLNTLITCGACNETNSTDDTLWCIDETVCGNNKTFIDEEYSDLVVTSDGNVMLTNARQGYDGKTLTCTRNCSDHHPQEHKITISIENSFRNRLLAEMLGDDTWYERELNRYLCTSGRSYGPTSYSWKFNGNDMNITDVQLHANSSCLIESMCGRAVKCLKNSLFHTNNLPEPYHVFIKHSACLNDDSVDVVGEFFSYVSVLVFPEVLGDRDEGIYLFSINGSVTKFLSNRMTETKITVKSNNCNKIEIRAGNVSASRLYFSRDRKLVCQVQANTNDVPQWFKDDQLISSNSSECDSYGSMYYTVETTNVATLCNSSHPALVHSFTATLHWCNNITQDLAGTYSCRIPGTAVMKEILVILPPVHSSNSTDSRNTEQLLFIWFGVLNAILIIAITITVVVWCWMRRSSGKKQESVHSMCDTGLPAYLHNYIQEMETGFAQNGSDPFEFPFDQLEFLNILGEGNFGCVRKARAKGIIPGNNVRNIVAVKTLKDNARPSDVDDLRQELLILKKIEPHCNILNLLGYCSQPDGPLCLIIEYAAQGSLKHFLTLCKQNMEKLDKPSPRANGKSMGYYNEPKMAQPVTQPTTQLATERVTQPVTHYINTTSNWYIYERQAATEDCNPDTVNYYNKIPQLPHKDYSDTPGRLGVVDIYIFLLQIAKGMEHIGKMKLIHRDLAARNILIAEGFVLKIGDFGLSRNLTDKDYYRKTGRGMIPVRWMALESLETGLHTYQSDVWSFGIVTWEILTFAEMPYGMEKFARSIKGMVEYLKSGGRLPCPPVAHGHIFYPMIKSCWASDSNERPSFSDLVVMFETQLSILLSQETV